MSCPFCVRWCGQPLLLYVDDLDCDEIRDRRPFEFWSCGCLERERVFMQPEPELSVKTQC